MEQMIQALLGAQWSEWKARLAGHLGIEDAQAGDVLSGAAQQIMGLYTQGKLQRGDLQNPQGVASLLEQLDVKSLAAPVDIDPARLEGGLAAVLPDLVRGASALLGGSGLSDFLGNLNLDLQ